MTANEPHRVYFMSFQSVVSVSGFDKGGRCDGREPKVLRVPAFHGACLSAASPVQEEAAQGK